MPTAQAPVSAEQQQAAYERWVRSELTGDARLTALRILYNDIRDHGDIQPETWDYFDLQEMTGGAESMDTQHITVLEGHYDPTDDKIVAAVAGGERVTYDDFTVSGLTRARERAAQNPDFAFQIVRDQIYHNNYHGPVKDMWRGQTDYDTVLYASTFPQDVIDALEERGRMIVQDLAYEDATKKGFLYGFRKNEHGIMEFFALRLGNATPTFLAAYLQEHGFTPEQFEGVDSHHYGQFVVRTNTGGTDFKQVAQQEAARFDQAAGKLTGKRYHFGSEQSGEDAYTLFKKAPKLWHAYRAYHRLLATHFTGVPLHDDLYDYLTATHEGMGFHVLEPHEQSRLAAQLEKRHITADMALACKKLMTYAHYATLNSKLEEYRHTGIFADIDGDDIMAAYGASAGGEGTNAAARGETFNDCDTVYGETSTNTAVAMAAQMGISLEEAMRRLNQKPERWSRGNCRNCERETDVWKEHDGGCNVCRKCSQEHTLYGQRGLQKERQRAQAEREMAVGLPALDAEMDAHIATATQDDAPIGTTRYVGGEQQMLVRRITVGGATTSWVATATGKPVDDL